MTTPLGIAITTFNSCELVVHQVRELRRLTHTDFDLVVADDGSNDDTVTELRALGVHVITGRNKGVAWNKNRGLFHIVSKTDCRIILLLDDDILPVVEGWEIDWIEATKHFGHVNYMPPALAAERVVAGQMNAAKPGLATSCFGPLIGCTREACAYVGYFDIRFGRWGFEHVDFTDRLLRLGYGGLRSEQNWRQRQLYVVLNAGVELQNRASLVPLKDKEALIESGREIILQSRKEPTYRSPWKTEEQMRCFNAEMNDGIGSHEQTECYLSSVAFADGYSGILTTSQSAAGTTSNSLVDALPRRFFMIHIPKTAGETINYVLTEMLGADHVRTHVESDLGLLTRLDSIPQGIKYVSGHHRLPDVLHNIDRSKWFIFVNLRNPVHHLISHLKWVKSLGGPSAQLHRNEHEGIIQDMACRLWNISLNDIEGVHRFIHEEFDEAKQFFDNCQVRYLIHTRDQLIVHLDGAEAVSALRGLDHVGFVDTLSDTVEVVIRAAGLSVDRTSIPSKNQSSLDEVVDLRDPAIRDFYRESVRWDALLYTAAHTLKDELVKR